MRLVKKLGFGVSDAYIGYLGDNGITPLDDNADEKSVILLVCDVNKSHLKKIQKECFELFPGFNDGERELRSGKHFWHDAMGSEIGNDVVWCVSDSNDDRVYLFHTWKDIPYHLGRVFKGHPLETACKWRFSRCKT